MIRRLKPAYELYNLFQKQKLQHNPPLYKKIGLKKSYYASISSKDFKNIDPKLLTVDHVKKPLKTLNIFNSLSASSQQSIQNFEEHGYAIIENYLDIGTVDKVNTEIEDLLAKKIIDYKYGNKLMFVLHHSELINSIGNNGELMELLDQLIEGNTTLFQSINFKTGSQQETHSDSIHMTTFPLGGLLGVWIALEDIDESNGPLHYYPGSHKLPYYLNSDYQNEGSAFMLGKNGYDAYEKMLADKIKEHKISKQVFKANKGDLLIWHANLLHGGEKQKDKNRTRKSMVFHYFDANRICYHEITQRPAFMNS